MVGKRKWFRATENFSNRVKFNWREKGCTVMNLMCYISALINYVVAMCTYLYFPF